jgi:hypothetical protein
MPQERLINREVSSGPIRIAAMSTQSLQPFSPSSADLEHQPALATVRRIAHHTKHSLRHSSGSIPKFRHAAALDHDCDRDGQIFLLLPR